MTSAGKFIVLLLIVATTVMLAFNYKKGRTHAKYIAIFSLITLVGSFVVSQFFVFDLCLAALGIIFSIVIFLLILLLKYRASSYLYIILFAIFSVAYLYSVDYVFDEVLKPHQQARIKVAMGMIDDPSGAGYNVNQSKIAIGSGGILGKGYLNGTQTKLKYVPEQDTDFIFCTVGEEEGFIGTTVVMLLFLALIIRLVFLAERQRTTFNRVYGYGVATILFFHLAINIGMVIGITPVIGIPLPFFSYGGSSLWAFSILLFIFLRLDASRTERL
jgi:rod shape determining protein RodA